MGVRNAGLVMMSFDPAYNGQSSLFLSPSARALNKYIGFLAHDGVRPKVIIVRVFWAEPVITAACWPGPILYDGFRITSYNVCYTKLLRILGIDTPEKTAAGFPEDLFAVRTEKLYAAAKILHSLPDVMSVHSFGQYLHVVTPKGLYNTGSIEQWLQNGGVEMAEVRVSAASIEDMFMYLLSEKDGGN